MSYIVCVDPVQCVVYSIVLTQACVSCDRYCMVNVGVDRRHIGWRMRLDSTTLAVYTSVSTRTSSSAETCGISATARKHANIAYHVKCVVRVQCLGLYECSRLPLNSNVIIIYLLRH